jgi:glycosyltransferase involved in cell wall biosynthesis
MNHVAMVIPGLDHIAGAENQVMSLAKGMRRRGWRVSVVALTGKGGRATDELQASGVEFLSLEMRKGLLDPRGWFRYCQWMHRERPQVVHAHLHHASWLVRWSRLCLPTEELPELESPATVVIDTLHSSSTGNLARQLGYRASDWLTDCVTAVSLPVAESHLAAGVVNREKLSVVNNGIDIHEFQPNTNGRATARRELGLSDEFLWLAAGRLEPVKDYPTLLRAFATLPQHARLFIAGDGSEHGELCSLSESLGFEHRVRFLGFQPDIKPWLHAADAFVLSSRWEGLPVCLMEAGACALPAVATDVPGSRDVIVHDRTGHLTPSGSHAALAQAMTSIMLSSPDERRAMGNLARLHITRRFNLESMLDRWETLYRTLLASGYLPERGIGDPISA